MRHVYVKTRMASTREDKRKGDKRRETRRENENERTTGDPQGTSRGSVCPIDPATSMRPCMRAGKKEFMHPRARRQTDSRCTTHVKKEGKTEEQERGSKDGNRRQREVCVGGEGARENKYIIDTFCTWDRDKGGRWCRESPKHEEGRTKHGPGVERGKEEVRGRREGRSERGGKNCASSIHLS